MSVRIINADVLDGLRQLPDESVHCVVTSPPYWGLRDYGVAGQLGLERTLGEHITCMVEVFREVRRVMRKDATLWLNYGDCYATTPNGRSAADTKAAGNDDRTFRDKPFSTIGPIYPPEPNQPFPVGIARRGGGHNSSPGLKAKDLCMIPNRLAIALQEDGWWVRSEIIWAKSNPMPESIKDRPASSHEKVFLLSKAERYFYDAEAVREPAVKTGTLAHLSSGKNSREHVRRTPGADKQAAMAAASNKSTARRMGGFNDRWNQAEAEGMISADRNLRNVWTIATRSFSEAHFATFPPEIPEICIKAGCPVGGTVLDPFSGAGTTCMVADRLQRNAIGIELNPEYAAMSERRIKGDRGELLELMEAAP